MSNLTDKDRKIIAMRMRYPNMSKAELGRKLGMSKTWITQRLNSELLIDEIGRLENDPSGFLEPLFRDAVNKLAQLMDDASSETVREKAAKDLAAIAMQGFRGNKDVKDKAQEFYKTFLEEVKDGVKDKK